MRVEVRLRREFFEATVADLRRPHPVAFERVGWVFAKQTIASKHDVLLMAVEYAPVAEDDYLEDCRVGASFNATAIRAAMQRSRATGMACLQIHLHDHHGHTAFSSVDCRTIDKLASSLRVVTPNIAHGGLVLSADSATARIWLPENNKRHTPSRAVIVGFPMRFGPRS
jgi:hypothetical protein